MTFRNLPLNPYEKTHDLPTGLSIMKEGVLRSGMESKITMPLHGPPGLPIKVASLSFPDINLGVNGKGLSDDAALASMYGEAVERISTGTAREIGENRWITGLAGRIMEGRWLAGYEKTQGIPDRALISRLFDHIPHTPQNIEAVLSSDISHHWVDAVSIVTDTKVRVPIKLVTRLAGSNGLAAGATIEEATIQAVFEVFERFAIWSLMEGCTQFPLIPEEYFGTEVRTLCEGMRTTGQFPTFRDFSGPAGVPVIGMVVESPREPENTISRRMISFGSSVNLDIAASRCITEYYQGWNFHISDARKRALPYREWSRTLNLYDSTIQTFTGDLRVLDAFAARSSTFHNVPLESTQRHLSVIRDICNRNGWDCLVVDMTREHIGVPVVRAIIPGISNIVNLQYNMRGIPDVASVFIKEFVRELTIYDNWQRYAETF